MKRFRVTKVVLFAIILSVAFGSSHAQITNLTASTNFPTPGTGHDYLHLINETVNPADGSVSVRISIPVPPARGLTLPFAFTYDSNFAGLQPNPADPGQAVWADSHDVFNPGQPNSALITGSMWSNTLPQLTDVIQKFSEGGAPGSPPPCFSTGGFIFKDPSGGRHALPVSAVLTSSSSPGITNCGAAGWSNVLTGGDDFFQAIINGSGSGSTDPGVGNVKIADSDGTVYTFSGGIDGGWSCVSYNQSVTVAYSMPRSIEDRNGNTITLSQPCAGGNFSISDTAGRTALSFQYASGLISSVTVSGIANPYQVTWNGFSGSVPLHFVATGGNTNTHTTNCFGVGAWQAAGTEIQFLALPNNQQYKFEYDSSSGLLNKITYPTGGYISYQWTTNPLSDSVSFADNQGVLDACQYHYDRPALQHRYVRWFNNCRAAGFFLLHDVGERNTTLDCKANDGDHA